MKRFLLAIAFAATAAASFMLFPSTKAFADDGGNCQGAGTDCNPGAALNCCNGLICSANGTTQTNGAGYCYSAGKVKTNPPGQ